MRPSLAVLAATLGLCACSTPLDAPLSTTFGLAAATLQSQAIAPDSSSAAPPSSSGARGAAAIRRYEAGQIRTPEGQATSAVSATALSGQAAPSPAP